MLLKSLTYDLRKDKLKASEKLAFFILRTQTSRVPEVQSGLEVPVNSVLISERELADLADLSDHKAARRALQNLRRKGWVAYRHMGQAGTMVSILRHAPNAPQKCPALLLKNQPDSIVSKTKNAPPLARGVSRLKTLSLDSDVSYAFDRKVNNLAATAQSAAQAVLDRPKFMAKASGQRDQKTAPNWSLLTEHVLKTWQAKKGAPFLPPRKDWHALKTATRRFQTHELAGLWDIFLRTTDPFTVSCGYSLRVFVARLDALVDDRSWRERGARFLARWEGAPETPTELNAVLNIMAAGLGSIVPPAPLNVPRGSGIVPGNRLSVSQKARNVPPPAPPSEPDDSRQSPFEGFRLGHRIAPNPGKPGGSSGLNP